ncbi:MAG: hypothetical protein MRZ79_12235 [Bacteroidia bacterium]|nr:hypothetical protein [Bacteroidia bacterium]
MTKKILRIILVSSILTISFQSHSFSQVDSSSEYAVKAFKKWTYHPKLKNWQEETTWNKPFSKAIVFLPNGFTYWRTTTNRTKYKRYKARKFFHKHEYRKNIMAGINVKNDEGEYYQGEEDAFLVFEAYQSYKELVRGQKGKIYLEIWERTGHKYEDENRNFRRTTLMIKLIK